MADMVWKLNKAHLHFAVQITKHDATHDPELRAYYAAHERAQVRLTNFAVMFLHVAANTGRHPLSKRLQGSTTLSLTCAGRASLPQGQGCGGRCCAGRSGQGC